MPCWPKELQVDGALQKYYQLAKDVLQPEIYPMDWPDLPKLTMLERQAKALGWGDKFKRVPQTTRFKGGPNSTGIEMYPSASTGMDSTGLNDGSKNSTLVNYLSDAWNWGAEMFVCISSLIVIAIFCLLLLILSSVCRNVLILSGV